MTNTLEGFKSKKEVLSYLKNKGLNTSAVTIELLSY